MVQPYQYKSPLQKNQYVMRTDAEIQAIIDDPQYAGWTKKDFRNAGILTRKETERKGLKFQHYGKKKDPTKVRKAQTKRTEQTKATSNVTTEQKLAAPKTSGLELSHLGSKKALVTPNNLAYLPKYTNKLSYFRFEKILNGIQADQQKILADTTMSTADKRKALAELAKADRTLRNKFKGQGYDKIKSRIKTREFPWGMGETEIIRDSSITLGEGKAGANIPLKTATKTEKGNIIQLGKGSLEKIKSLYKNSGEGSNLQKGMDDIVKCADGCFIKVANKNPEKTLAKLNKEPQKLIRLFRGEGFKSRSGPTIKEMAETFGVSQAEAKKKLLSGQWFTSDPVAASSYTDKLGKTKYVDVTPREFLNFKKYVDRVNKTKSLSGGERFPVNTGDKISIIPRYKLDEFEEAGKLKSQRNIFKDFDLKTGYAERPPGVLTYDGVLGGFVDSANPGEVVGQNQLKAWANENPMPVNVDTLPIKPNKSILKTVGKTLAKVGTPLPTALIDGYFINKQMDEGKSTAEIAKDPLNWLGLATMEPLTKIAGANTSGGLNAVLRLGLNPATIRGITRFAGLPGLAISTAMTAYDQYKKYQNEEGFVYNLFNKEGN